MDAADLEFLFSEELPLEPDDSEAHIGNESDFFTFSDDEEEIADPIQVTHSRNRRVRLEGTDMVDKVNNVLDIIQQQGLDLAIFLDAVCWGDAACISDSKIQFARTGLMVSDELPGILQRCYNPPRRGQKGKGKRPAGGRRALLDFATHCVSDTIDREMKMSAHLFLSPPEELSEKHLTTLDFEEMRDLMQIHAPVLWRVLRRAAYTPTQVTRNKHKDPDMVVLHMISQAQYTRSNRRGRVAKLWSIYLKACGLSARAFDALHALGILMSHKWTADTYGTLSDVAMDEVRSAIHVFPWVITHDNMNVALRVFSQRLHNQSHFISGCAYTVWLLPIRAALAPDTNRLFQLFRAQNCGQVFDFGDVLYGTEAADDHLEALSIDHVLRILLDSPDFFDYAHRNDILFDTPIAIHQLLGTLENVIKMYILRTSTYEEASYEGTLNVMNDTFQQLLINSKDEQTRTALERVICWIGDQLTIERLRGLWKYRHEDHNSFDRLDYMIPIFGWFHLVMAFANSLHKQYLGSSASIGSLRQAFDVLKRKGLISQSTKGPFWHNLDEALHHISEAHFRASWLDVGKVKNLADLKAKSPAALRNLAGELIQTYASREAVNKVDRMKPDQRDTVYRQWTMWNMDILPYLILRKAIKAGDVGIIEDLLPTLLFRFAGGGNPKYAIEMLELFQGLKREWPEGLRYYIKEFCWLFTRTGLPNNWLPFDLGQEENIADIKVNYRSMGPGATMEYMGKVSPAIPTLRKIQRHMETQFKTNTRGARHGVPNKEEDVAKLATHYAASKLHTFERGRKLKTAQAEDFVSIGANNLERLKTIDVWFARRSHARATGEDWSDDQDSLFLEPLLADLAS
ncbi:hypothetical protein B0H16DRAFT_1807104 [Mycena metata]|uniref:DUF6589 domain-containing protein n=1 Tax=Mycena metata TaxID=1033252 RepID=A0AAD7JG27_9AGAR|nr:hypothetical protein B0H16DRAFT_1807104 [Mycena metata]